MCIYRHLTYNACKHMHITTTNILLILHKCHTQISHIYYTYMHIHIHKRIHMEASFYSKFSNLTVLRPLGPGLAATTRNIHQMALFCHVPTPKR